MFNRVVRLKPMPLPMQVQVLCFCASGPRGAFILELGSLLSCP